MRVATTYDNGNIFMHFGRSEQFKIYDIRDGKVLNEQVVGTGGTGHGALAGLLANGGVDTLICGGIGGGAINALAQAGITVYAGAGQLRCLRRGPHCRHARTERRGHLRLPWT